MMWWPEHVALVRSAERMSLRLAHLVEPPPSGEFIRSTLFGSAALRANREFIRSTPWVNRESFRSTLWDAEELPL